MAVRHDETYRTRGRGIDEAERFEARGDAEESRQLRRHNADPAGNGGVRAEIEDRICFHDRMRRLADRAENAVENAAVLHVGGQKAEIERCGLLPADRVAAGQRAVGAGEEDVGFGVERFGDDAFERFIVEIGDADIDIEIVDGVLNGGRGHGQDGKGDSGKTLREGAGNLGDEGQGGGDCADAEAAFQALPHIADGLRHGVDFGENAFGVGKDRLAFGGQPRETVAALDEGDAQLFLKLPDRA